MLKVRQIIPSNERKIVDQFSADLPEIIAGNDPFIPDPAVARTTRYPAGKDFETKKCANGCDRFVHYSGLCHICYRERHSK